ncbi:MAG TPA: hypothetical protein VMD27_12605 [Candidatus Aquilonibacter sp.]|nr:hypothetical protein [Candidatus Aquilonibacter sp.]
MKIFNIDITPSEVTSVCALVVSVASLWATRRHQRLSVTPHLADYTHKLTANEGLTLTYDISNNGIGPARIKSFVLFRDGKAFPKRKEDDYVETFVREHLGKKLNYKITYNFNFGEDDSLKAGDTHRMVQIFFPGAKSEDREKILALFEGIGMRIEYESFYGQKFIFDRKAETKLNNPPQSDPTKITG